MKKYYEAYDLRYQQVHKENMIYFAETPSPIVGEMLEKYRLPKDAALLEIGCGEGRDAFPLLKAGWNLLATDISQTAVNYCKSRLPESAEHFAVLDCLRDRLPGKYDLIYAVAVLHMLTEDEDRSAFFAFLKEQLKDGGLALICSMGDGEEEFASDPSKAFDTVTREHLSGKELQVASTSCRVVSLPHLEAEAAAAGLRLLESGHCSIEPDFPNCLYIVVKK